MRKSRRDCLALLAGTTLAGCTRSTGNLDDPIAAAMAKIEPLFKRKRPPQPGEWLADHVEPGQTYRQFRALIREPAISKYRTLRLVPIGPLSEGQSAVLQATQDILRPYFGLELVTDAPVNIGDTPAGSQRILDGVPQLLTSWLLNDVLVARRQERDAAVLGITAYDLWPGPGWNFVFGQASLTERVGVWSMARNGDVEESAAMRKLCSIRTAMTATHETGHMFGIRHCVAYQCGMNGSNNSDERDHQPLEFCPQCQAKLWWTCGLDPLARSRALEGAARKHGFERVAEDFARQNAALADG